MRMVVLWENHATGHIHRFGPHAFLVACVADRLQMNRFELLHTESIRSRCCNGNGGVLRELGRRSLWDAAPHLIAVLDTDKLHELLGGEARKLVAGPAYDAWSTKMEERCRERLGPHDAARLTICLLDRNLETLLEAIEGASVEKDVVERDAILQRAAAEPALLRRALAQMPSWADLVETVAHRVRR